MSDKRPIPLSRAELVRQRRAQRTLKEMEQTTKRALKPIAPVTSRAVPTRPIIKPKRVDDTRTRRFNIALGLPEIHFHKPSFTMPRFRANWRFVSFVMALLLGTSIYFALTLPYFHVPSATILGNTRLTREEMDIVLGVTGQSIFTVKPDEVATRLRMNYPELASVKVEVYLPNHVYVTVTERQPVILWQQDAGYTWIDSTGVAFRPRGASNGLVSVIGLTTPPAGVALLDDPYSPLPFMERDLVDAVLVLSPSVPAGSTMIFDPTFGLGWNDPRGWQAFFGTSAKDMALKVRVYQSLVDSLVSRNQVPEFISVVYPDAPFYRMKEATVEDGQE
ncbi:MAG: FtsQ-type POTRA domain-containing protein [Anaerolineales bacterium]|nr:FtsQ-type POTRA domain-containing protein [Anaerolineales bacterium]